MRVRVWLSMMGCTGLFCAWTGSLRLNASAESVQASLQQVRYWSSATYTRVVFDLDREVDYRVGSVDRDDSAQKPPRIYVDLPDTRDARDAAQPIVLEEGPVQCIRSGRYDKTKTRVVLDLRQAEDYNVFRLDEPFRIVLDLWWKKEARGKADPGKGGDASGGSKVEAATLPVIVLDPGHGGDDPGAIGRSGLKEKDVALAVAKGVKAILEAQKKARVVLTRDKDQFLPLETRAWVANSNGADLFVSIHANAHPSSSVRGVETYYLDNTTDRAAMRVAAMENATPDKNPDGLSRILIDLRCNANAWESNTLALMMQGALVEELRQRGYGAPRDLGAKGSLFYVLIGAHMPSILVEVGFITNPSEENRLKTPAYRKVLAQGVAEGITGYLGKSNRSDLLARQEVL